jgi:hypothetical protein
MRCNNFEGKGRPSIIANPADARHDMSSVPAALQLKS